jgi:GxxExxY protein
MHAETQRAVPVSYKGVEIGIYIADVIVENAVICEVKAVRALLPEHQAQLLNYLKATGIEVGLLLNFGARVEYKRMILNPNK